MLCCDEDDSILIDHGILDNYDDRSPFQRMRFVSKAIPLATGSAMVIEYEWQRVFDR